MNSMDKENMLYERVKQLFTEIKEYASKTTEKIKEQKDSLTKSTIEAYKKDPESKEVKDYAFEIFINNYIHQRDMGILQTKFMLFYSAFLLLENDELKFDQEVTDLYNELRSQQQNQVYTIAKGDFQEIEEGSVEKIRKNFKDNNTFEKLKKDLQHHLDGQTR